MNIQIRGVGIQKSQALSAYIERRMAFAFSRFYARMDRILVRFSDQNGPKGGQDKVCQVGFTLRGMAPEIVEAKDADLYLAIDLAAAKAGRRMARLIERSHN
jgi:ribosomal subunit interface protein